MLPPHIYVGKSTRAPLISFSFLFVFAKWGMFWNLHPIPTFSSFKWSVLCLKIERGTRFEQFNHFLHHQLVFKNLFETYARTWVITITCSPAFDENISIMSAIARKYVSNAKRKTRVGDSGGANVSSRQHSIILLSNEINNEWESNNQPPRTNSFQYSKFRSMIKYVIGGQETLDFDNSRKNWLTKTKFTWWRIEWVNIR